MYFAKHETVIGLLNFCLGILRDKKKSEKDFHMVRDEIKRSMSDKKKLIKIVRGWVGKNFKKSLSSYIDYVDYYWRIKWGKG